MLRFVAVSYHPKTAEDTYHDIIVLGHVGGGPDLWVARAVRTHARDGSGRPYPIHVALLDENGKKIKIPNTATIHTTSNVQVFLCTQGGR